jgi:para-aminobenzoate synthetase component 1
MPPDLKPLPWIAPEAAFRAFAADPFTCFFDSSGAPGPRARASYLCLAPARILRAEDGKLSLEDFRARTVTMPAAEPFTQLAHELARFPAASPTAGIPFTGGAAGFIGYDMGAALDRAPRAPGRLAGMPDMLFGLYDTVLAFDHAARRATLVAPADRQAAILARLAAPAPLAPPPPLAWRALVTRDEHIARIRRTLGYIAAGDIYQANIAAAFEAPRPPGLDPAALFLHLRAENPAPFGAYIGCGAGCAVLSASPERFLSLDASGLAETRPIKGTRRRGATPAEDAALAAELLASAKDRAENLMIVDLLRNDISRVADGVTVPALCALESFAHVHHLVSSVRGRMRAGLGPVDLLRAAFPGGSITGAPKLRAMEIIAELEARARGPYCGAAAWIGKDGAMDSNILIRTVTVARDRVVAQAGGGIVADSDPAQEWDEVLVKIMPLLRATGAVAP